MFGALERTLLSVRRLLKTSVLHITDCEGHYGSFSQSIMRSNIVEFDSKGHLNFQPSAINPFFIYGGDVTDRGIGDMKLIDRLVTFKKRYPSRVFLLVGNRDASKTRFYTELHPQHIRQRLLEGVAPYWLQSGPHSIPIDYVKKHMQANGKNAEINGDIKQYIHALSDEQCQLIYIRWMLEQNLGCTHTFSYHAQELAEQTGQEIAAISESMVLKSIIRMASPAGLVGKYLELAQVGVVIPHTGILAVHGGLSTVNIGRIPGMQCTDEPISDARVWMSQFNHWYRKQVQNWASTDPATVAFNKLPACSPLDTFSMSVPAQFKTVVTESMLDKERQFVPVPLAVNDYLNKNKISVVLTGHQPCGDHPAILRSHDDSVVFINGDTGYANASENDTHDTRGMANHTLQLFTDTSGLKIKIDARVLEYGRIKTKLMLAEDKIVSDHLVGKLLPGNRLVQCQLSNGSYRVIHQQGYRVSYSIHTADDIEQILSRAAQIQCNL